MRDIRFFSGLFIVGLSLIIIVLGALYGIVSFASIYVALIEGNRTFILSQLTRLDLLGAVCLVLSVVILKSRISNFLSINFFGTKKNDPK